MKFVLKQHDTALLSFDLRSEGLDGFACTLLEKEERHRCVRNYNLAAQRLKPLEAFIQRRIDSLNEVRITK